MKYRTQLAYDIAKMAEEGYNCLYKIGSGKLSPNNKQSKLAQALAECAAAYPEAEIDYAIGRKLQCKSQGRQWAVLYKAIEANMTPGQIDEMITDFGRYC